MGLLSKHRTHHRHDAAQDGADQARQDAEELLAEIDTIHAVMRWYQPGEGIRFGASTRCPACGVTGFVVSSDTSTGNCINYCLGCHADWVISLRALDAVAAQAVSPPTLGEPSHLPVRARPEADPEPVMLEVDEDLAVEATPEVLDTFLRPPSDRSEGMTPF